MQTEPMTEATKCALRLLAEASKANGDPIGMLRKMEARAARELRREARSVADLAIGLLDDVTDLHLDRGEVEEWKSATRRLLVEAIVAKYARCVVA